MPKKDDKLYEEEGEDLAEIVEEASYTGVRELDNILGGGFPKGAVVLLAGSSGSGKTILSFQWLFAGVHHGEKGIYFTVTEPLFKAVENLEGMSFYNRDALAGECSTELPRFCTVNGTLVDRPSECGCPTGKGDCDGQDATGCEIELATDVEHCGTCGTSCDDGNSCTTDSCTLGQCVPEIVDDASIAGGVCCAGTFTEGGECCGNDQCLDEATSCSDNKCATLACTSCQQPVNHTCVDRIGAGKCCDGEWSAGATCCVDAECTGKNQRCQGFQCSALVCPIDKIPCGGGCYDPDDGKCCGNEWYVGSTCCDESDCNAISECGAARTCVSVNCGPCQMASNHRCVPRVGGRCCGARWLKNAGCCADEDCAEGSECIGFSCVVKPRRRPEAPPSPTARPPGTPPDTPGGPPPGPPAVSYIPPSMTTVSGYEYKVIGGDVIEFRDGDRVRTWPTKEDAVATLKEELMAFRKVLDDETAGDAVKTTVQKQVDELWERIERVMVLDMPVVSTGKPTGEICLADDVCSSKNCGNMVCCERGKSCCTYDGHCGSEEVCDEVSSSCVPAIEKIDTAAFDDDVKAMEGTLKELLGEADDDAEEAMRTFMGPDEVARRMEAIKDLTDELIAVGGLDATTPMALRRARGLKRALEQAKDRIVTTVSVVESGEEVDLDMDDDDVVSLLDTLDAVSEEARERSIELAKSNVQRAKAELIEVVYASGRTAKHTRITRTVTNSAGTPIENAVLIIEVPKSVAVSALELHYTCIRTSGRPCPPPRVVRDDPIITWDLETMDLDENVAVTYTTTKESDPNEVESGAAAVVAEVDVSDYKAVEEEKADLRAEAIKKDLSELSDQLASIDDEDQRHRMENLIASMQESLEKDDLPQAHAAVARVEQELTIEEAAPKATPAPAPAEPETPPPPKAASVTAATTGTTKTMKSMANTLYMIALAIVGIFGAGLFLRPRVFATKSPTVEKVFVNQGTHILGGKLQLTVSVDNRSSFAVRDVKVAVDAPEVFDVESSELELGEVKLGTREQAEFELIPRGCALGTITGAVSYVNDIGNTKTVELDPVEVTSVFPFLKSKKLSKKAFAAKVKDVGHREATLRTDADPVRVIDIIRARCSPLYTVNESLAKERTKAVADYAALDAREGTFIGVRVRAEKKKGAEQSKVNFAVYGEDAELVRTMLDELEGLIGKADGS